MPAILELSPEAQQHLHAFLVAANLSMVDGYLTCHFGNGDIRKVEVTTFHAIRLASTQKVAYPDRRVRS